MDGNPKRIKKMRFQKDPDTCGRGLNLNPIHKPKQGKANNIFCAKSWPVALRSYAQEYEALQGQRKESFLRNSCRLVVNSVKKFSIQV